jgi:hypothetical protein
VLGGAQADRVPSGSCRKVPPGRECTIEPGLALRASWRVSMAWDRPTKVLDSLVPVATKTRNGSVTAK